MNMLILAALGFGLACDDSGSGVEVGASEPGVIEGVVARQKTGVGVPGVLLVLQQQGRSLASTLTTESGGFSFGNVPTGEYEGRIAAPELAGLDARFDALEPEVTTVRVGDETPSLVFAVVGLVPARITGRITCGGVPAFGARVRVVGGTHDAEHVADETGAWSALNLDAGAYTVLLVSAPCTLTPAWSVVELRQGQMSEVVFTEGVS